jgi:hypothetical protein
MRNRTQYIRAIKNQKGKRYFKSIKYPDIPLSANDIYIRTTIGDRLDSLADQFYNDVRLWWIISTANPNIVRKDSYALKPNLEIRIPSNTNSILESFKALNK